MIAVIIGLGALIVAVASAVLAQLRIRNLERRLEAASREMDQRLAAATAESTSHIEAWVRSSLDDSHAAQRQIAADTLTQFSTDLVADIQALFASFRATVKADTAALVGQALAEYERRPPHSDISH